jgi:hypothetical protein
MRMIQSATERQADAVIRIEQARFTASSTRRLPVVVGFAAAVWFMLLSGWLGVTPGTVIAKRHNVLFSSDSALWAQRMIGDEWPAAHVVHPLETFLWRPPIRALQHVFGLFLPWDYAGLLAARLVVALVAGVGVGFMAFLALHQGIKTTQLILLFIMYLLFTCNSTAALPEHFGISNGLLSIAFVFPIVAASPELRALVLVVLTVLCGGTTITNVLFPAVSYLHYCVRSMRTKIYAATAMIVGGLGAFVFLYIRTWVLSHYIAKYKNLRLLYHPLKAGLYSIYAMVAPVIGPSPRVLRFPGWDMVSYEPGLEPFHVSYYFGFQAIGAIAWIVLFLTCLYKALRDESTRTYMWLPLGWLLFNVILHNIWGDEFVLYSPHWSWALMGIVILGARDLSRRFIAAIVVPVVASQIYTLFAIKQALQTIVQ